MKSTAITLLLVLLMVILMASCQRKTKRYLEGVQSSVNSISLMHDIQNQVMIYTTDSSATTGSCATVTSTNPIGTYPNSIEINFGTDGCTGSQGFIRKGKISVDVTGPYSTGGSVFTWSTDLYFVNDWQVVAAAKVEFMGEDRDGNLNWTMTTDGRQQFVDPAGLVSSNEHYSDWTRIAGGDTEGLEDDVYEGWGQQYGRDRGDEDFWSDYAFNQLNPMECSWVSSGSLDMSTSAGIGQRYHSLDFGDGTCDDLASVTLDNNKVREVTFLK